MDDINSKVISVISEALRIDKSKITNNLRIYKDLKAESLDMLDIRFSIEQQFDFKIGEKEIVQTIGDGMTMTEFIEIFTVDSIIKFVQNKLENNIICS